MGFAADAGLLVATERGMRRVQVIAVGPDATGLDATTHAVSAVDVAGPDAGTQAELGVVGDCQGFGFILEGRHANHRPEDLFLEHTHLVVTLDQGRLHVITGGQATFELLGSTAGEDLRAFLLSDLHVGEDLVELLLGCLGADHGVGIQRIATLDRLDLLHHHFHEGLEDRFLNQCARRAGADLTLVEEGQHQAFGSLFDECRLSIHDVFEEDVRALATQLHGARNDVLGGAAHDVRTNRGRAGEGDLGDAGASSQRLACLLAEALNDVQHARWQQIADHFDEYHDRQRGLLGRLEHDAVASGQGRSQLPGGHQQREVPRNDLTNHAQRLMEMVGRGGVVDLCSAAFLSADAAREVTEVICSQRYVGVQGFTNGFAVVPGFGDCELLQIRLDAVGDLQQDVGAILDRGASPGISSGVSSIESPLDIFGTRTREFGDHFTIDRRGVDEVFAFDRRHEFTTNVIAVARLEGNNGARGTGLGIDHDGPLFVLLVGACAGRCTGHGPILGSGVFAPVCTHGSGGLLIW